MTIAAVSLPDDEEETLDALREGLDSIDRGEGLDVDEADVLLRGKLGFDSRS
jgi:hypothetical protein